MGRDLEGKRVERTATVHQDGDGPCWRAAFPPGIVLVTFSEPTVPWYTSIRFSGTTLPAGTVTFWLLPDTVAEMVAVAPSAVSVTVHIEPAGIPSKLCDTLPSGVPAGITNSGATAVPSQLTWIVTGPW